MASVWKKVFTSADTIGIANGGTGANLNSAGGIVSNGTQLSSVALSDGQLLVGATGSAPGAQTITGDFALTTGGVATIATNAVTGNKIADHGVGLGKLVAGTQGDIIAYNASGDASVFGIGSDGQVLTVDDDNANGLKLEWKTAPAAANNVIAALNSSRDPMIAANGTGASQTLHGTVATLSFDSDETFVHKTLAELDAGSYATQTADNARGALYSKTGFQGQLAGEASGAVHVKTVAGSGTVKLGAYGDNVAGFQAPLTQNILTLNIDTPKLTIAGDLEVTGTTTTIDSTVLTVADAVIKVGEGATSSSNAQSAASATSAGGLGISVANGDTTADVKLARFVYEGYADSASVLGWNIAQESHDAAADLEDVTAFGVGVMHVQSGAFTAAETTFDIGVGAMLYTTNGSGGLFIQTA